MIDILTRACRHPLDYAAAFREQRITLTARYEAPGDIHIFDFALERPTYWKPGQHAIFRFPDAALTGRSWRPFSIASSSHENKVRLATIIPALHSDFKAHLSALEPGGTLRMNGPFGEFHAHRTDTRIVGVAGGIGITPFRAMLVDAARGYLTTPLHLVYAARENTHTFRDEFDQFTAATDRLTINYVTTPEETNAALDAAVAAYGNDATYFVSGSPGMIGALRERLHAQGIERVINDPFKGYS